jgi:hypothetical protein
MGMTFPAVIDYSYGRPSMQSIKDYGAKGVMRYLGNDGRCIFASERDQLLGAGLGIGLIWETTAARPLDGWQAGVDDAHSANYYADQLGAPNTPIYYAVDFQPTTSQLNGPVSDYFGGVMSVAGRPVRAYGCAAVVHRLCGDLRLFPDAWQCAAWSYPGTAPGTPIYDGGYNLVMSPYASFLQNIGYVLNDSSDHNSLITTDCSWMWGFDGEVSDGDEMTDEDWNRMASLLNTMVVGKLAEHTSLRALCEDERGQFVVLLDADGPHRYSFPHGPPEVTLWQQLSLVAPSKPEPPPQACPPAFNVSGLTQAERDVLYSYPSTGAADDEAGR